MRIAVIGGGIGGLAATLQLRAAGFDAQVYEQARELGEIGAGIQISPNASRLLIRLGLGAALGAKGVRPVAGHQRRWEDGRTIQRSVLNPDVEQIFGAPYYHFHRADLLEALSGALPASSIHVSHRLVQLADNGSSVELSFANGRSAGADLVIGADGIHSRVREHLFGPEKPRFTGCIAYRGLVPRERLERLRLATESANWHGPHGHFVHYFVAGGRLHNFVAVREQDEWVRESWTDPAEIGEALAAFEGWHPTVHAIIAAADRTFKWGLFDRDPLASWTRGRVALLGDACHAMLPFMAQGAAQSIEDGATLAACLRAENDVTVALKRYEALRRPRATRLQEMSRANKIRFHLPDGPEQEERDAQQAKLGDRSPTALGWLYEHDAGRLD